MHCISKPSDDAIVTFWEMAFLFFLGDVTSSSSSSSTRVPFFLLKALWDGSIRSKIVQLCTEIKPFFLVLTCPYRGYLWTRWYVVHRKVRHVPAPPCQVSFAVSRWAWGWRQHNPPSSFDHHGVSLLRSILSPQAFS